MTRWSIAIMIIVVISGACSTHNDNRPMTSGLPDNLPPILDGTQGGLGLVSGSTPDDFGLFTGEKIVQGEEFWAGMATIDVAGDSAVTIEEATVLSTLGVEAVGVFIGRRGIDGLMGATPRVAPGRDQPEYSRKPALPRAKGSVLKPGGPGTVVYAVAKLSKGTRCGGIYGSSLRVREGDHVSTVLVLSPTFLFVGDAPSPDSKSADSHPCTRQREKFISDIEEM